MSAPPRTDPAPLRAAAGSWRHRMWATLVLGVVTASLVRGVVIESYHVPSESRVPSTLAPGDRVLVLKTGGAGPQDLVLTDTAAGARVTTAAQAPSDAVGRVVWRFWPLERAGSVAAPGRSGR